jgi:hypothetical protein
VFKVASIAFDLGEVYTQLGKIEMFRRSTNDSEVDPRNHLATAFIWMYTGIAISTDPKMKAIGELTKLYANAMAKHGVKVTTDKDVLEVFRTDPDIINGTYTFLGI